MSSQKGFSTILIVFGILFILGVVGATYYFEKYQSQKSVSNNSPIPTTLPANLKNWTSLTNGGCNLSMMYPNSWLVRINYSGTGKMENKAGLKTPVLNRACTIQLNDPNGSLHFPDNTPNLTIQQQSLNLEQCQNEYSILIKDGYQQAPDNFIIEGKTYPYIVLEPSQVTKGSGTFIPVGVRTGNLSVCFQHLAYTLYVSADYFGADDKSLQQARELFKTILGTIK